MSPSLLRSCLAEALGTFFLVLAGCGAVVVDGGHGLVGHVGISLTFGLVILVLVLTTGHVSGAHLNPAVTLAFFSLRRISAARSAAYVASQCAGAALGAFTLGALFPDSAPGAAFGATLPASGAVQSLLLETLLTAMLMLVIVSVATDARAQGQMAALAIGGAVAVGALWGGPVSGASMNPARSLGPALAAGTWTAHWIYWVGPITGAVLGAWAYELLREHPEG